VAVCVEIAIQQIDALTIRDRACSDRLALAITGRADDLAREDTILHLEFGRHHMLDAEIAREGSHLVAGR